MDEMRIVPLDDQARWSLRVPRGSAESIRQVDGFVIDLPINRAAVVGDKLAARLGPDEWLLCAPVDAVPRFDALEGKHHSLVDVSHRYTGFTVEGRQAHILLAAGCPLDLDPAAFAAGAATRTVLGKAEIVLWRLGETPSYRVECARSYAPYVLGFMQESAREWGGNSGSVP